MSVIWDIACITTVIICATKLFHVLTDPDSEDSSCCSLGDESGPSPVTDVTYFYEGSPEEHMGLERDEFIRTRRSEQLRQWRERCADESSDLDNSHNSTLPREDEGGSATVVRFEERVEVFVDEYEDASSMDDDSGSSSGGGGDGNGGQSSGTGGLKSREGDTTISEVTMLLPSAQRAGNAIIAVPA